MQWGRNRGGLAPPNFISFLPLWKQDKVKKTEDGPSWLSLVSALDTIGEHGIADTIKDTYCQEYS